MRSCGCATLLLSVASFSLAQSPNSQQVERAHDLQTAYCPNIHQLEVAPSQKLFFDGAIGKRHVRMYLDRGGSGVVGLFFDLAGNWDTTLLGGTWNDGEIEASDSTETHPATGHLKASLAANRLTGTWTAEDSGQPEPVSLISIPEPRCNRKEAWKRFDDPASPVSFSYPASWHLEHAGDTITLTCPNPSEIAYDQHIDIYEGVGTPKGPTNLLQCGNAWKYGPNCDCSHGDSQGCEQAKVSRTNSATILDVSGQEWRIYCHGGGYVGQGEGEDRVLLLGGHWLEIIAPDGTSEILTRLIETITLRPPSSPK